MNTKKIENQLNDLYKELEDVVSMSGEEVCRRYNADDKGEIVAGLQAEIEDLEEKLHGYDECEDDGMDYINLQISQGLPVTHW
ncbi:hypothetical protein [Bacteroides reticulotermitis]|uniref:Uncharacterized protein n=2 Tax=Bacteroides reticulotermitis TaxID=1133319 RepID=W4UQC9_9BACE|nr:hypothetical protein [Bacteroides reticulotermitis]MBB4043876.1 hypothetical protein [Bacteroides reticulotermitis]GAE83385.1 hypothetical protein JCM10512_1653 [Bacteroides reticulotermitis JCM 10512]